jgi:hypothetical protein
VIKDNLEEIRKGAGIEAIKAKFDKAYENKLEPEFAATLEDLSWHKVIDENDENPYGDNI